MATSDLDVQSRLQVARDFIHKLHTRLVRDGHGNVLAHLPPGTSLFFQHRPYPGSTKSTLSIVINKHSLLATPDYRLYVHSPQGRVHELRPEEHHPAKRILEPPFNWALSAPGRSLNSNAEANTIFALVRYYCTLHMIQENLDLELRLPNPADMALAMRHLRSSDGYKQERRKYPERTLNADSLQVSKAGAHQGTKTVNGPFFGDASLSVDATPYVKENGQSTLSIRPVLPGTPTSKTTTSDGEPNVDPKRRRAHGWAADKHLSTSSPHVRAQRHRRRQSSASQESDDLSGLEFSNIITPDHDVNGEGPIRRDHKGKYFSYKSLVDIDEMPPTDVDESDGGPPVRNKRLKVLYYANTPPGPDALKSLRKRIAPYLLSRLPKLHSMQFEDHKFEKGGIGLQYVRLRLFIGHFGDNKVPRMEGKVWAYLKPHLNQSDRVAPTIEMRLEEQGSKGNHNEVQITWAADVQTGLVSLEPFFTEVTNDAQLKTAIKYCFLLATERKLYGYERHCIAVNTSFVTHLTKICDQLHAARAEAEINENEENTRWLSNAHQNQHLVSGDLQGSGRQTLRTNSEPETVQEMGQSNVGSKPLFPHAIALKDSNRPQKHPSQQMAQKYALPTRTAPTRAEAKEMERDVASHKPGHEGDIVSKDVQTSSHIPSGTKHTSGSSSGDWSSDGSRSVTPATAKPICRKKQPKPRSNTRPSSPNPLSNRRPPKSGSKGRHIDILKKQRKTIGGRISRNQSSIADYRAMLTEYEAVIAELENKEQMLLEKKAEVEKKLQKARYEDFATGE